MAASFRQDNVALYVCMGLYLLAMAVVAFLGCRRNRRALQRGSEAVTAQYGGRFGTGLLIMSTCFTVFSGYNVMGVPQEASLYGFLVIRWIPAVLVIVCGMLLYYPRLRRLSVARRYRSPNDFITDRYRSRFLRVLSSLCTCAPQFFFLTVQLVSMAELLQGVTQGAVPKVAALIVFAIIVLAMETIGGQHGIVLSDSVQGFATIFGLLALFVLLSVRFGTMANLAPADCRSLGYVNQTGISLLSSSGMLDADIPLCVGFSPSAQAPGASEPIADAATSTPTPTGATGEVGQLVRAAYTFSEGGASSCPSGYITIQDTTTCTAAGEALGARAGTAEQTSYSFEGCVVDILNNMYFFRDPPPASSGSTNVTSAENVTNMTSADGSRARRRLALAQELGYVCEASGARLLGGGDAAAQVGAQAPGARLLAEAECVPYGCIGSARPDFFSNPSPDGIVGFFFFMFNFLAFPLNPHMVQRVYIARSDIALKWVMISLICGALLVVWPGIIAGVIKATFALSWPLDAQDESALVSLFLELRSHGAVENVVVALLTCAEIAAIMSTADSVLSGVANALSVDVFQGLLRPGASQVETVRFGRVVSVLMTAICIVAGNFTTSADFGMLITVQNGILLNIVPAFLLGLYLEVSTQAVTAGCFSGILAFLLAWLVYNPLEVIFVPAPNFGVLVNCIVLAVVWCATRHRQAPYDEYGQHHFGARITPEEIVELMQDSKEPRRLVMGCLGFFLVLATPIYGEFGLPQEPIMGLPVWAIVVCCIFLICACLAFVAVCSWKPHLGEEDDMDDRGLSSGMHGAKGGDSDEDEVDAEADFGSKEVAEPKVLDEPRVSVADRVKDLEGIDIKLALDPRHPNEWEEDWKRPAPTVMGKEDKEQQRKKREQKKKREPSRSADRKEVAPKMRPAGYSMSRGKAGLPPKGKSKGRHLICCLFFRRMSVE